MTTLFPETTDGEGGDTAAEGGTVLAVAVRRGVRKARAKEAAEAGPPAPEVPPQAIREGREAAHEDHRGCEAETWHGLTACYWLIYPHSVHTVSAGLADKFRDAGKVVTLGTWADAEAVRTTFTTRQ